MRQKLLIFSLIITCYSCGNQQTTQYAADAEAAYAQIDSTLQNLPEASDTIEIRYAQGLSVSYETDGVHVRITDPSTSGARAQEFVVVRPAARFICTTALQLGNFEVLGLEDRIVGINSLRNLFSPRMREQLDNGKTLRIGREGNFDLESVLATQPDYIFVSASKHGGFEALRECGVPLIHHHGYKENTPLGQAEWIKLIGLLTGETRRANAVFNDIERRYLELRDNVSRNITSPLPSVVSGRQMRDGWYVVGGRSYMAQIFADAGADYILSPTLAESNDTHLRNDDTGGVTLDFESVYARAVKADFWQTDGSLDGDFTLQTLADEDKRYTSMNAYRQGHVIFCNLALTPYRELAGVQPHLLLADFVHAFHTEILPDYEPVYYKIIK